VSSRRTVGIAMNGITGRMGLNQHLVRSIVEMRKRGGIALGDGTVIWPEPLLVGRNAARVAAIAREHGIERWTTDIEAAIADPACSIFFDAGTTAARAALLEAAILAGKHVYCEKPLASTYAEALRLAELASARGVKNGDRSRQALSAGLAQTQASDPERILWPDTFAARRVRLLGLRR